MVYDVKNRFLHTIYGDIVRLNKVEHKMLICLSDGNCAKYDDIEKYVAKNNIGRIVHHLREKGLNIQVKPKIGLILKDEIYFE